jgi:hypothetical protein
VESLACGGAKKEQEHAQREELLQPHEKGERRKIQQTTEHKLKTQGEGEDVCGWRSPSSRSCQSIVTRQVYVREINTLTYTMSSSSSSKHLSKKRKLSKVRSRPNNDDREKQIAEFWNKTVERAEYSWVRTRAGKVYSYPAMVTSADRSAEPPAVDAPEEAWVEKGWILGIETGKTCALKFPVGSHVLDSIDWRTLPVVERECCVAADSCVPSYLYCPRNLVDKVEEGGTVLENYYLAGAVRWAKKGEASNCRLILDPDNPEQCVLISTLKTQSNTEWKLDRDYAHRTLELGEYEQGHEHLPSDEESETSGASAENVQCNWQGFA